MITVLRPTYQLTVTIKAPGPQVYQPSTVVESGHVVAPSFWDQIKETGCDDVVAKIRRVLAENGFAPGDCTVTLEAFRREP